MNLPKYYLASNTGESILLSEGFFADGGSNIFMTIEDNVTSIASSKNLENNAGSLSLNEFDLSGDDFSVYPNPSDGIFSVQNTNNIVSYSIKRFNRIRNYYR